jgi:hypothetical protein
MLRGQWFIFIAGTRLCKDAMPSSVKAVPRRSSLKHDFSAVSERSLASVNRLHPSIW